MDGYSFTRFDACIDIPNGMLPVTMTPEPTIELVRKAVEAIPGAAWISVDCSGLVPANPAVADFIRSVRHQPAVGGAWDALAERVRDAMRIALSGMSPE